jgi:hypothetical protein
MKYNISQRILIDNIFVKCLPDSKCHQKCFGFTVVCKRILMEICFTRGLAMEKKRCKNYITEKLDDTGI